MVYGEGLRLCTTAMSRCFPFPPPGYEKKDRTDDADHLTKPQYSAEKVTTNSLRKNEIEDHKSVQELGKRIRDEERPTESQFAQGATVTKQRRPEMQAKIAENNIGIRTEEKHRTDYKKEEVRKFNGQNNHFVQTRGLEKSPARKLPVMDQKRTEGAIEPMEKKEENNYRENNGNLYKHKDKDRESKSTDKDKEKKKEEKGKEIGETFKELTKLKPGEKNSLLTSNVKSPLIGQSSAVGANHGKRKQPEINGFLLDNGHKPNKLSRPTQLVENGRKLELSPDAGQNALEKQSNYKGNIKINGLLEVQRPNIPSKNNLSPAKVEENGQADDQCPSLLSKPRSSSPAKIDKDGKPEAQQPSILLKQHSSSPAKLDENGKAEAQQPSIHSKKRSSSSAKVNENGKAREKPPHPDMKYLSEILTLPKVDMLDLDEDEEWLFGDNSKKSKVDSLGNGETQQVWNEALRIDSADVVALPYVIPF
ncbi:hypothetical protein ACFE04_002427 [Oxalis oulophora]